MNPHYAHVDMPQHEPRRCRAVFPCTDSKKPAVRHWQGHFASAKRLDAARYIGISPPDDIIIFDVDTDEGITTDDIDVALGVSLPWDEAFLQSTPSGGAHYAFKAPVSVLEAIPNKSKAMGLVGFDLRLPRRGYVYTGEGYRTNALFPSLRYALENGNWPNLPDAVADTLAGNRPDAAKQGAKKPDITMCKPTSGSRIPTWAIPNEYGTRNACLLKLARWYKGQNPAASADDTYEIVREWYRLAENAIRTKDFSSSLREFRAAYKGVTTPIQASFDAVTASYQHTHVSGKWAREFSPMVIEAIKLCKAAQKYHKDAPFYLSCRILGEKLGVSHVTAAKVLKLLVRRGILALSKIGEYIKKGASLASEYFMPSVQSENHLEETSCSAVVVESSANRSTSGLMGRALKPALVEAVAGLSGGCRKEGPIPDSAHLRRLRSGCGYLKSCFVGGLSHE